jgi:hypothetical protein
MPAEVARELLPGEQLLWEGRPAQGVRFRPADVPLALFGLMFTGISLVFVVNLFPFGILVPHLWIGLYFLFGHFFVESKIRATTGYAITETRAIVVRRWPTYRLRTVPIRTAPEISLSRFRDGTATISFGPASAVVSRLQWGHHAPPAIEFIDDADRVMQLLHRSDDNRPLPPPRVHPRPPII